MGNKAFKFKSLGITSAKLPHNTHLWWTISSTLWYMVDSTNQKVLLKSVDKGANWTTVTTRDHKIQSGFPDGTFIWFVDCDNPGNDFDVWKISVDGNDTITSIGTSATYQTGSVFAHDIIKHDSDFYALISYENPNNTENTDLFTVTSAPFSIKKAFSDVSHDLVYYMILDGDNLYTFLYKGLRYSTDHSIADTTQTFGICFDGTDFFLSDHVADKIWKYNSSWVYQTNYDLNVNNGDASGVEWNGTYFYVANQTDNKVYKYNSGWVYQSVIDTSGDVVGVAADIYWDGTYFWLLDNSKRIHKYNSSWVLQTTITISETNAPFGITGESNNLYINDNITDKIHKYDYSGTQLDSWRKYSWNGNGSGICFDDDNVLYTIETGVAPDKVLEYICAIEEVEYNIDTDALSTNVVYNDLDYEISTIDNLRGVAYDGSDLLYFVLYKESDSKNYLQSWSISGSSVTELGEYNIAIMLDRNCSGTVPNEMEKAFSIAKDENNKSYIYEIKPRKGGLIQLQTIEEE